MAPGAAKRPHRPVNTTSVMTRGLVSARKSRQWAVIGVDVIVAVVISVPAPPFGGI